MNDPRLLRCLCWTLLGFAVLSSAAAEAQISAEPSREPPRPEIPGGSVGGVRQAEPKVVYHLLDNQKNLIPVPDFSFEKWDEYRKLVRDLLPATPPRYEFPDGIQLIGTVRQTHLEIEAVVPIRFTASNSASEEIWVRVPLRLSQAIQAGQLKYEGPARGLPIVNYSELEGHVVWLRAKPGTRHQLSLALKVPLESVGNETRLSLVAPPGASELVLTIPESDVEANFLEDSRGVLTVRSATRQQTVLVVHSMGGPLDLAWRKKNKTPVVLEAKGMITVEVAGDRLNCDARLTVSSPGNPIQSILIRLPPKMDLIPAESASPALQLDVEGMDAEEGRRVRAHRRDGGTSEEFDVRLRAVRTRSPDESLGEPFEVGGFEVSGARIQSGTVEFQIDDDLHTEFIPGDHVRQDDQFTDGMLPRELAPRFKYTRQPFSLQLRVRPKEPRVHVEPHYVVFVDADQARLEAKLKYRISGARARQLELDLAGWQVDRVLPSELFSESISREESTPLVIPLAASAYPLPGEFELSISAHTALAADQPFSFVLPRPAQPTTSAAADLTVVPADNVELVLRTAEIEGLVLTAAQPGGTELPQRQQPPLFFLEESSVGAPTFVSDVRVREREVAVAVSTQLRFSEHEIEVAQRFRYRIDFEPLAALRFAVPVSLAENTSIQVKLLDKPLEIETLSSETWDEIPRNRAAVQHVVHLPEDQIGSCELTLRYVIPTNIDSPGVDPELVVPLVLPADSSYSTLDEHTLELLPAGRLQVAVAGAGWSLRSANTNDGIRQVPVYEAEEDGAAVTVAVSIDSSPRQTSTRLQRVWVQTWLTEQARRDRVTFQLTTNERQVRFHLPPDVQSSEVQVLVNRREWNTLNSSAADRIDIELNDAGVPQDYTIELWYWFDSRQPPLGRLSVAYLASLEPAQRLYWQLILPQNEHLLWAPAALTPEYQWKWNGYRWGRQPNLGLRELETRLAASAQDNLPAARNEYLFSTISPLNGVEFHGVNRATIVLVVSGGTLIFGLLLIYVSALRSPTTLTLAGVAVVSIGAVFPEPTVLAVQAGLMGWGLVLVAQALKWSLGRHPRRLSPVFGKVSPVHDSVPTERSVSVTDGSSRLATTISPHPYSMPAADSDA